MEPNPYASPAAQATPEKRPPLTFVSPITLGLFLMCATLPYANLEGHFHLNYRTASKVLLTESAITAILVRAGLRVVPADDRRLRTGEKQFHAAIALPVGSRLVRGHRLVAAVADHAELLFAAAAAKDTKAIAAAATVQSNEDVLAYEAEQNGLAADQKDLQKDTADAEMALGEETSAHNQTFQAGLAAAAVVQEHAWADAQAAYEMDCAGAAAQYETDVMQAEAGTLIAFSGNDPTMIAVANAWLQFTADTNTASLKYEAADKAAWLTEQTDDTAAWLADVSDKDAAEAQQEVDDRAAKYTQMIDDAAAGVKDVSDTMTADTPRMSKEAAASQTSIGIQADDMVAKVAKDIAATLVETTSLVADALEWWQTATNAWAGMVAQVETAGVTTDDEIASDIQDRHPRSGCSQQRRGSHSHSEGRGRGP